MNVLKAQALAAAGAPAPQGAGMHADGRVYVRPHDIEIAPYLPDQPGLAAVVRYIHTAGSAARVTLEQVQSRDTVEVETSRLTLTTLDLKVGDLVNLRLRQAHSFDADYAI